MANIGRPRRRPPDVRPPFSWIGGALCLDFVNTVTWLAPGSLTNERLRGTADLMAWVEGAGLAPSATDVQEPRVVPDDDRVLATALELRDELHTVLRCAAHGFAPDVRQVAAFNTWVLWASGRIRLEPGSGGEGWRWRAATDAVDTRAVLEAALAMVVQSATELLRSPDLPLLRDCANAHCGWLFIDRSRKRNRRWCEMRECGGRAKARRYRARKQYERER
ncbi:MAG TPA: ABATE domain-containing protein [Gemmatimonadaceae bacterium]